MVKLAVSKVGGVSRDRNQLEYFLFIKLNACQRTPLIHVNDIISLFIAGVFDPKYS